MHPNDPLPPLPSTWGAADDACRWCGGSGGDLGQFEQGMAEVPACKRCGGSGKEPAGAPKKAIP